jgi:hypothetical protein
MWGISQNKFIILKQEILSNFLSDYFKGWQSFYDFDVRKTEHSANNYLSPVEYEK